MATSHAFRALLVMLAVGCSSSPAPVSSADSAAQELDIDEGTFTVPAGQEVIYCVRIPVPAAFAGRDLALTSWSSDIPPPAHHYFLFYEATPTTGTVPVLARARTPSSRRTRPA